MYYPWWGDSWLGMEGKIIFSYCELGQIPEGELSIPSTAVGWHSTAPGAATKAAPMGAMQMLSQQKSPSFSFFSLLPLHAPCILSDQHQTSIR